MFLEVKPGIFACHNQACRKNGEDGSKNNLWLDILHVRTDSRDDPIPSQP